MTLVDKTIAIALLFGALFFVFEFVAGIAAGA
jgi:hypothetical protein